MDRYLRLKRQKNLNSKTPGFAIIEYEDGEREMVNLQVEKLRKEEVKDGIIIEILWPLADIFPMQDY